MTTADIKKAYSETICYLEDRSSNPNNCNPLDMSCDVQDLCGGLWYDDNYIPRKPEVSGELLREAMGDRWETKHAFYYEHGCVRMIMFERAAILWWLVRWCETERETFTRIVLEYVTQGQKGDADLLRSILAKYGCNFVADMLEDSFFNTQGIDWAKNVINRYAQRKKVDDVSQTPNEHFDIPKQSLKYFRGQNDVEKREYVIRYLEECKGKSERDCKALYASSYNYHYYDRYSKAIYELLKANGLVVTSYDNFKKIRI